MYVYACMHANMHGCMDARMVEVWRFGGMDVCVCVVDWFWYQLWGWAAPML